MCPAGNIEILDTTLILYMIASLYRIQDTYWYEDNRAIPKDVKCLFWLVSSKPNAASIVVIQT